MSARVFMGMDGGVQSWYALDRAAALKRGQRRAYTLMGRQLVAFRSSSGRAYVLDARCPHLGADLAQGQVRGEQLRCPMHHWCFDGSSGQCAKAPGYAQPPERHVRAYPVVERFGLLWIFWGPSARFALPQPAPIEGGWRAILTPPQLITCHPHLVIGNGLDMDHIQGLHQMRLLGEPRFSEPDAQSVRVAFVATPRQRWLAKLLKADVAPLRACFTAIAGSIAVVEVEGAARFAAMFTGKRVTDADAHCATQSIVFTRRGRPQEMLYASAVLYALLRDDAEALSAMRFSPDFTTRDEGLMRYAQMLDRQPLG